jgi:fused signal recognition particle receptor
VVTKLDGSAKGGVLFALAREFNIPIRYIGLGEKLEDLRVFDPEAFVDALLPERLLDSKPVA